MEQFKSSFNQLGGEPEILEELELPLDDLPLPGEEPAAVLSPVSDGDAGDIFSDDSFAETLTEEVPPDAGTEDPGSLSDTAARAGESSETDFMDFGDLGDLLGGMDNEIPGFPGEDDFSPSSAGDGESSDSPDPFAGQGREDADLGAFIDSIPDDLSLPAGSEPDGFLRDEENSAGSEATEDDFVLPEDFGLPPDTDTDAAVLDDFNPDDLSPAAENPDASGDSAEDFDLPPGLLDGLADEIEAERASSGEEAGVEDTADSAAAAEDDSGDSPGDMNSFPDFDTAETLELQGEENIPGGTGGDAETGGDAGDSEAPEDFSLPDELPDFDIPEALDLPGEEPELPDGETLLDETGGGADTGEAAGDSETPEDFSLLEELPDFDTAGSPEPRGEETLSGETDGIPEEFEIGDTAFDFGGTEKAADDTPAEDAEEEDSFDLGGELRDFDNSAVLEELPGDSFDNFNVSAETLAKDFDLGGEEAGSFDELEEFSLPGIDTVPDRKSARSGGARPGVSPGEDNAPASGDGADAVEEIRLTDEEFESLQETLSSYPLNLRIACEELIAEQAVIPDEMSRLIKLLVNGAPARETANLAGKILGRTIPIPRGFEKKTGEELEVEQSSFAYIFVHNFLPVLRLFMVIAAAVLCVGYLGWRFVYTPLKAESIYKLGYERIGAGEYARANERFNEAYRLHEKKSWFYRYARAFRDARQYTLAEEKYRELLYFTASKNKRSIPEKEAVLEFAGMETNTLGNYEAADEILRHNILDFYPMDRDALLALGDNSLAWGEYEPARLEDARESYAKIMERYGRSDPLLERMLKYFIRTDNLEEVLPLHSYFMASAKSKISASTLTELGGYFLDKRFEKVRGVPNEYLDRIGGIREILLRATEQDPMLPESYYHLARYYGYFENYNDERLTLDVAVKAFAAAREESPKRITYHINTLRRYGEILVNNREFFPAEEILVKGVNLYEDALSRRLVTRSAEFGRLYTALGDLEYFVKDGDMESALDYYRLGEQNGWAPPEIQYRMGAAHYQLREWGPALDRIFAAYREISPNRRVLYALGNVSYMRGNYFAAQGYYDRLLEILNADRERLPPIPPSDDETSQDLAERLMTAQNNLGVTLDALTERTGDNRYRSRAQGLYADSERAWDILTRNPTTMLRMRPSPEISAPGVNPAYLNVQNSLHPVPDYESQFFLRIDKDINEPSPWEELAPPGYRLSEGIHTGR